MARRKARAVEAPQTEAEAVAMIADDASAERELLRGHLMTQQQIDVLKGNLGALAGAVEAAQKIRLLR